MVFFVREFIFCFREPSAAPQNDQEAMKFLKKSGSSSYDPSVQVNISRFSVKITVFAIFSLKMSSLVKLPVFS